jgi:hypothetical protein
MEDEKCTHERTTILEPHLAGANSLKEIVEVLYGALEGINEHICDSKADSPCSQMWYQDICEEALKQVDEMLGASDETLNDSKHTETFGPTYGG